MLNKEELKPNFDYWCKLDFWTLEESAFLLNDIDPKLFEINAIPRGKPTFDNRHAEKPPRNVIEFFEITRRAIQAGNIGPRVHNVSDETEIEPSKIVTWALEKGFNIPDELKKLLSKKLPSHQEETPPYLDPNHEFFSKEIEIAISAWMSLYNDSNINIKKSHKQQIKDWLRKNDDQLSKNSIERIAILVNPNKKGGVPPTNEQ